MTRFRLLSLVLLSLLLTATASAQRRRAVRAPAAPCSYSLAQAWGASIAASGAQDAVLTVAASPASCTSWNAYSLDSWVTVERAGNVVLVDVAPNPTGTERVGTILVAGIKYQVVQEPTAEVISPPIEGQLLKNGGFDRDLSFWGWQDRFPNGSGSADWAALDGTDKPNSGSIRIRNARPTGEGPAYQQLQCVAADAGQVYEYGFRFFATSTAGSAVIALVQYEDEGCNTATIAKETRTRMIRTPGTWQSESYTIRLGSTTKSVLVVIGGFAAAGNSYEVFLDDVYVKKR